MKYGTRTRLKQFKVKSNFKNLMGNKVSFQIEKLEFHNK